MLTAFQERKLANLFAIHDLNRDGVIAEQDFADYASTIAKVRGWRPESTEHQQLTSSFLSFWDGLKAIADRSRDARVTLREWLAYWDSILHTEGQYDRLVKPIAGIVFPLLDRDGDGHVTAEDYRLIFSSGGMKPETAGATFAKLDTNGDGRLSVNELLELLDQFFRSNDSKQPGNWLFGPVEETS